MGRRSKQKKNSKQRAFKKSAPPEIPNPLIEDEQVELTSPVFETQPSEQSTVDELTKEIEKMQLGTPFTLISSAMPAVTSRQHHYIINYEYASDEKTIEKFEEKLEQEKVEEHESLIEKKFALHRIKKEKEYKEKTKKLQSSHDRRLNELNKEYEQSIKQLDKDLAHDEESLILSYKKALEKQKEKYKARQSEHSKQNEERIKKLQAEHEKLLEIAQSQHEARIKEIQDAHHAKIKVIKTEHEEKMRSDKEWRENDIEKVIMSLQTQKENEIDALTSIGIIELPSGLSYILQDFWDEGIECYLSGGYVRNRLLRLPVAPNEDMDVVVNCAPENLPERIKRRLCVNGQPKQLKYDNIDFWCEPWDSVKAMLLKKDFYFNTFLCHRNKRSGKYEIYDLLSAYDALYSPYITFLGKIETRLPKEPSLIMRAIRFCGALNKKIHPLDFPIVQKSAKSIKTLDIGIFLKNLEYLFLCAHAKVNLKIVQDFELQNDFFLLSDLALTPKLLNFWNKKLEEYFYRRDIIDYYYLLAMFCILPRMQNKNQWDVEQAMQEFFDLYSGKISNAEKPKIIHSIKSIMVDRTGSIIVSGVEQHTKLQGLYSEFKNYEQDLNSLFQNLYSEQAFSPFYNAQHTTHQQMIAKRETYKK